VLNRSAKLQIKKNPSRPNVFFVTSQGKSDSKPITTVLAAGSTEEMTKWVRALEECIASSGGTIDRQRTRAALQATARMQMPKQAANLEALKELNEGELCHLKIKKVKELADYMHIDYSNLREPSKDKEKMRTLEEDVDRYKKELAARIVSMKQMNTITVKHDTHGSTVLAE